MNIFIGNLIPGLVGSAYAGFVGTHAFLANDPVGVVEAASLLVWAALLVVSHFRQ